MSNEITFLLRSQSLDKYFNREIKKNATSNILPITCHMVNFCTQINDKYYEYNNLVFNRISLIGFIRNIVKRDGDSQITCFIDDMTSSEIRVEADIDELIYNNQQVSEQDAMETDDVELSETPFVLNQFVKVFGTIRSCRGKNIMNAFKIIPIKELIEVIHHMLESNLYYSEEDNSIVEVKSTG